MGALATSGQVTREILHVALWPGNRRNTAETTRFLAREGRSHVLAVSGLLRWGDVPPAPSNTSASTASTIGRA